MCMKAQAYTHTYTHTLAVSLESPDWSRTLKEDYILAQGEDGAKFRALAEEQNCNQCLVNKHFVPTDQ